MGRWGQPFFLGFSPSLIWTPWKEKEERDTGQSYSELGPRKGVGTSDGQDLGSGFPVCVHIFNPEGTQRFCCPEWLV